MKKTEFTRNVVVVDVDGIVADFWFSASKVLKKIFGHPIYPVAPWEAKGWGIDWLGFTKEQEEFFWDFVRSDPEPFWSNEREMAPNIVSKFHKASKDNVWYWCTTREDTKAGSAQQQTEEFLTRYGFKNPHVVVSERKEDFCYSVKADLFLDDKFLNCKKVKEKNPNTKVYFLVFPGQAEYVEEAEMLGIEVIYDVDHFIQWL